MTYEILNNHQMSEADRLTIESGVEGFSLMTAAGKAVAEYIRTYHPERKILVLCGPGNNGGDGFVVAKLLQDAGYDVRTACLVGYADLKGDAKRAAEDWEQESLSFENLRLNADELIVDAVFGTGFSGGFRGTAQTVFKQIKAVKPDLIAVDIPSGVNGATGDADDFTPKALATITFCRKKLGHVLYPGAEYCGDIRVVDIGIPDKAVIEAGYEALENHPSLWRKVFPVKEAGHHKYDYGHALILGGVRMTGAACMAAQSALRVGAGLCTIAAAPEAADIYRSYMANIIYEPLVTVGRFKDHLADARRNVVLIGPGAGLDDQQGLQQAVVDVCGDDNKRALVLDADGLTVFGDDPDALYSALKDNGQAVMTPHEGEFKRIFPSLLRGTKLERAKGAAALCGAVVILKGADTVIAAPDGRCVINAHSSPYLASAGTGDVLAGLILGLRAQGMPKFEAACAAVWIHGEAGLKLGAGMIATDLPDHVPDILNSLLFS